MFEFLGQVVVFIVLCFLSLVWGFMVNHGGSEGEFDRIRTKVEFSVAGFFFIILVFFWYKFFSSLGVG